MSQHRKGKRYAQIRSVLIEKNGISWNASEVEAVSKLEPQCFYFDGKHVYFHLDDKKNHKVILYDSVSTDQYSTYGPTTRVRLRP